jgi:hypothetical protein
MRFLMQSWIDFRWDSEGMPCPRTEVQGYTITDVIFVSSIKLERLEHIMLFFTTM